MIVVNCFYLALMQGTPMAADAAEGPGFARIVFGQGIVNLVVWLFLFGLLLLLPILGLLGVIQSGTKRSPGLCLVAKLLPCMSGLSFLMGVVGTITSMISAFAALGSAGANKDMKLALAISAALWEGLFGGILGIGYLLAFVLALVISHSRKQSAPPPLNAAAAA